VVTMVYTCAEEHQYSMQCMWMHKWWLNRGEGGVISDIYSARTDPGWERLLSALQHVHPDCSIFHGAHIEKRPSQHIHNIL
jgi:hypothetical protein